MLLKQMKHTTLGLVEVVGRGHFELTAIVKSNGIELEVDVADLSL